MIENYQLKSFALWRRILFWVVLILFTIVKTKILHYSSLCYFPLSFLAAQMIYRIFQDKQRFREYFRILLILVSVLLGSLNIAISFLGKYMDRLDLSRLIRDDFALANLEADVSWTGWESLTGIFFILLVIISIFLIRKKIWSVFLIFLATALFAFSTLVIYVPKIEKYSQNAAIEFFTEKPTEDAYLVTLGYKSYAHLFYGKVPMHENPNSRDKDWLMEGDIDKPVYASFKINKKEKILEQYPELKVLYSRNGFVFAKRDIKKND